MECCHWHHVMEMPVPMVAHDQKVHVAPHFNLLDGTNTMVSFFTVFTLCGVNDGANGIT